MDIALLFLGVIVLLLMGAPIAVALGLSSFLFLLITSEASVASMAQTLFEAFEGHATLLAIPFFILASAFMSTGGVARRIIDFSNAMVGHYRGGLAIASVFACMIFAALSGSSPSTVVAVGSIVIAGMIRSGYSREFAAGVVCNAGTLGILIPPSIVMVVYATATEVSVGRMFLAGVVPGLLAGLMLMVAIAIYARIKNMPSMPRASWSEAGETAIRSLWGLFTILIILGGIYGGVFTPTEAAAVAAVYAIFVALFIYRDMGALSNRAWLRDAEIEPGSFGFRMLAAIVIAGVIALMYGFFRSAPTDAVIGFGVFAPLYLLLGAYLLGAAKRGELAGAARLIRLVGCVLALAALIYFWRADLAAAAGGAFSLSLGAFVLAFLASVATVGLLVINIERGVEKFASADSASYGRSVATGGYALGRGVGEAVVFAIPNVFHPEVKKTLLEAAKLTVTLMFIIANALILKHVLTEAQAPQAITEWLLSYGFGPVMFLVAVNLILLIGGQFMEPSGLLIVVAPLVFPVAVKLGIDPIHLGIIMVVNMEIGMITPPVGLNLFVTAGVARMSVANVVKAATPLVILLFFFLILITYVPWLSTFLYQAVLGPQLVDL